jgi:hypothetical protein
VCLASKWIIGHAYSYSVFNSLSIIGRLPLWSSGQSFWLQIQGSRVRFPTIPDFLRSSGSGTVSTQPREDNWGATWKEKKQLRSRKLRLTAMGIRCANHATPSIRNSWYYFANKRRFLGRYSSPADKATEFFFPHHSLVPSEYRHLASYTKL